MCCRRMRTQSEWKVQRVGRDASAPGLAIGPVPWNDFRHALLHLAGRLVRKGHGQDVPGLNAGGDHVRNAERDDTGLAGAGARQDQHRSLQRFDGKTLLRIERAKVRH